MTTIQPMLASPLDSTTPFPLVASPKIDGVRAIVKDGVVYSRRMKPIPNEYVQEVLGRPRYEGFDGELVVGPANARNLMQSTMSGVMTQRGAPDFRYIVFDLWDMPTDPFRARMDDLRSRINGIEPEKRIVLLEHYVMLDQTALELYEHECLTWGYEGVMLRKPTSPYKYGRSTSKQGYLLKLKRWSDGEATVIGVEELMHNHNPKEIGETGHAKRSTHAANLVPGNMLGALTVQANGVTFSIGSGFTSAERQSYWRIRERLVGLIVTYKHFAVSGVKDAPRFPIFRSFRSPLDL